MQDTVGIVSLSKEFLGLNNLWEKILISIHCRDLDFEFEMTKLFITLWQTEQKTGLGLRAKSRVPKMFTE